MHKTTHGFAWLLLGALSAACHRAPPPPAADSCQKWAAEICKRVGDKTTSCEQVQQTLPLLTADACAASLANTAFLDNKMADRERACPELRTRICADLNEHSRACKLATEQTKQFDADRCVAMLGNYAEVKEAIQKEFSQMRIAKELQAKVLEGNRPSRGPVDGKLQLVVFMDFENRDCKKGAEVWRELESKHRDKLHVVIRFWPLEPVNPHARLAAEAALAAHAQGKFWEMHDVLLANQQALERADLERYATEVGLDLTAFKTALDKHTYGPEVDLDLKLVDDLRLGAMPTLILNGERMIDGTNHDSLFDAVEEFLATST